MQGGQQHFSGLINLKFKKALTLSASIQELNGYLTQTLSESQQSAQVTDIYTSFFQEQQNQNNRDGHSVRLIVGYFNIKPYI